MHCTGLETGNPAKATDETQMDTDKNDARRTTHLCFICASSVANNIPLEKVKRVAQPSS